MKKRGRPEWYLVQHSGYFSNHECIDLSYISVFLLHLSIFWKQLLKRKLIGILLEILKQASALWILALLQIFIKCIPLCLITEGSTTCSFIIQKIARLVVKPESFFNSIAKSMPSIYL